MIDSVGIDLRQRRHRAGWQQRVTTLGGNQGGNVYRVDTYSKNLRKIGVSTDEVATGVN